MLIEPNLFIFKRSGIKTLPFLVIIFRSTSTLSVATDKVEVERKIITKKGNVLIPDRLNINKLGSISIIDYKTGAYHNKHETQINSYGSALIEMGYSISEKIIIYCSTEGITLKKV